ncbi:MAG TPA: hypothetical protein ACHBX0_02085 [Arsenophonus sp.]
MAGKKAQVIIANPADITNDNDTNYTALIARSVNINAKLHAQTLVIQQVKISLLPMAKRSLKASRARCKT